MLYFQDIHLEIDHLKTMIRKINYPLSFIDSCIMLFIKKLYTPKIIVQKIPKRDAFVSLPFLGSTVFQIQNKLEILFTGELTFRNLKIAFTIHVRVKYFFKFQDKLPEMLCSVLFYKYISEVATMLPITVRPNAIISPNF